MYKQNYLPWTSSLWAQEPSSSQQHAARRPSNKVKADLPRIQFETMPKKSVPERMTVPWLARREPPELAKRLQCGMQTESASHCLELLRQWPKASQAACTQPMNTSCKQVTDVHGAFDDQGREVLIESRH